MVNEPSPGEKEEMNGEAATVDMYGGGNDLLELPLEISAPLTPAAMTPGSLEPTTPLPDSGPKPPSPGSVSKPPSPGSISKPPSPGLASGPPSPGSASKPPEPGSNDGLPGSKPPRLSFESTSSDATSAAHQMVNSLKRDTAKKRLSRFFAPRSDGSFLVDKALVQMYNDPKQKEDLISEFLKMDCDKVPCTQHHPWQHSLVLQN